MHKTRRDFVATSMGIVSLIAFGRLETWGQSRRKSLPDPPLPGDPQQRDKLAGPDNPKNRQHTMLVRREQQFRDGIERLYQLTNKLREEVKTTSTANVLSVKMYKRMQEIEKLARHLEATAKG
jgi:hypothetical protein